MTDRLEAMTILVAVVDTGSFSAASRQLRMPLATVSRKVGELEQQLKTRLLLRSTRKLSLTEAGRDYVAACRRILDEVHSAERAVAGEFRTPRGDLVISAPIVFGRLHVLPVVTDFLRAFPEIDVRLVLSDRRLHLLDEHVDVALRIGDLPDSEFVAMNVSATRPVVCASPAYFAARGTPEKPADLAAHDCVTFDTLGHAREWTFTQARKSFSVPVRSRLVVNTAEAAIDAAISGTGITRVLCYQVAAALRAGTLVTALDDFEPPRWPISLVHAGQGLLPLKLRAFLDYSAPVLRERIS